MGLTPSVPAANFSAFWGKKMKTLFRRLDWESNGRINRKDFNTLADYYIQLSKLDANSKRGKQVRRRFIKLWEEIFEKASKDGEVDESVFIESIRKVGVTKLIQYVHRYSDFLFDLLDANGNGTIMKDEYAAFGKLFRFPDKTIDDTFRTLDHNNDTNITDDEFLEAFLEFAVGDDPKSPFNSFCGPLFGS